MKILVVSDNHGDENSLEELIHIYEDEIDHWFHCGDSEFKSSHSLWDTFKTVNGNMDYRNEFPDYRVETVEDENFVIVHGHKHQVKFSFEALTELANENNARIVFYGHTHIANVTKENDIYFINPGSISQPRGSFRKGSYLIYEKNNDEEYITYYDWNHNKIEDLSQKIN
ncbi:MAG TPA: metallophosphoesterase [Candidatus Atopostipes pullistercoris]|uniref:Phosphoesterase n=1 Tax=Candidatus Atopostipes pullistercoris TaxID=2838467 RepID=A0A9D2G3E7_9LACT|nr:metallophosphoesterase [Candidatus Atopostipes pullistercoris]